MTRNEYIQAFNTTIDAKVKPLIGESAILLIINYWLNQIDSTIVASGRFKKDIATIASRAGKDDIKKTFKGSRVLAYLVNKDLLNKFGVESRRGKGTIGYHWFGDVEKYYLDNQGYTVSEFANCWAREFRDNKMSIIKSATKLMGGDYRTISHLAEHMIKVKESGANQVIITAKYGFFTPVATPENVKKYFDAASTLTSQMQCALNYMRTVEKIKVDPITSTHGWKGWKIVVTLREVKCAKQPTVAEIHKKKNEEIMNAPHEVTTLEDLIDNLNNEPVKQKAPEIVALETAYNEALAVNKKATEDYTKAKRLWEESTNRLDKLEQALELLK
ncbi:hypothetical protein MN01_00123 [Escherichia phage MN01]|nr:hypothetical protein MN01_00123 [Escherichia phage MN01]